MSSHKRSKPDDTKTGGGAAPKTVTEAATSVDGQTLDGTPKPADGDDITTTRVSAKFREFSKARSGERAKQRADTENSQAKCITFGTVTVKVREPDPETVAVNIKKGQDALERAAKVLLKPGVKLNTKPGVPLYRADPENPKLLIRLLNGREERVKLVGDRFRVVK